jgi:hypothetical protein
MMPIDCGGKTVREIEQLIYKDFPTNAILFIMSEHSYPHINKIRLPGQSGWTPMGRRKPGEFFTPKPTHTVDADFAAAAAAVPSDGPPQKLSRGAAAAAPPSDDPPSRGAAAALAMAMMFTPLRPTEPASTHAPSRDQTTQEAGYDSPPKSPSLS